MVLVDAGWAWVGYETVRWDDVGSGLSGNEELSCDVFRLMLLGGGRVILIPADGRIPSAIATRARSPRPPLPSLEVRNRPTEPDSN